MFHLSVFFKCVDFGVVDLGNINPDKKFIIEVASGIIGSLVGFLLFGIVAFPIGFLLVSICIDCLIT